MKYTYQNHIYSNLFELGKDIYLFQESFTNELKTNPELMEMIKKEDENKYLRLKKLLRMSLSDEVVAFRASLIFNPHIEFSYRKKKFDSLNDIGNYLLMKAPETDSLGLEIIHYNLLSTYMLFTHLASENKEQYENITEIEKLAEKDINYSYFLLGYYLSGKKTIRYHNEEYKDIYSLLYFLKKEKKDEASLAMELIHSPYLKAYSRFSKDKDKIETFLHLNEELDHSEKKLNDFLKKRDESIQKAKQSIHR